MRHQWLSLLALATGCGSRAAPPPQPPQQQPLPPSAADTDWPTYNNGPTGERYAMVPSLTPEAASRLTPVCVYDTGKDISAQTGPIVIAGTMYFTDEDTTYAIDAATCRELWKQIRPLANPGTLRSNRGVAYHDGRLFRGFGDGHVVAYDAASGTEVWDVAIADPSRGESVPMSPLASDGFVYIANAGGDSFGVTGRIYSLRARDGTVAWRFDVVPDTPEVGATWASASDRNPRTGGTVWTTLSLDPVHRVVYASTGNAAPAFTLALRSGQALYTNSVVALSSLDGTLLGSIQPIQQDEHDHDVAAAAAVIATRGGRRLAIVPAKDGRAYAIKAGAPRELSVLYAVDTTTRENLATHLTEDHPVRFCPGTQGGSEWNGAAFSPAHNLVFVGAVDWCTTVQLLPSEVLLQSGKPGATWTGSADSDHPFGQMDPAGQWRGWITAFDADTGQVVWKYEAPAPVLAGVTVTSGGAVLTGDLRGALRVLDARTGSLVYESRIGNALGGGLIAYAVADRPYVAAVTGQPSPLWPVDRKETAKVVVLGVP